MAVQARPKPVAAPPARRPLNVGERHRTTSQTPPPQLESGWARERGMSGGPLALDGKIRMVGQKDHVGDRRCCPQEGQHGTHYGSRPARSPRLRCVVLDAGPHEADEGQGQRDEADQYPERATEPARHGRPAEPDRELCPLSCFVRCPDRSHGLIQAEHL